MKIFILKFIGFCGVGGAMTLLSMLMIALMNEVFHWNPLFSYIFTYVATLVLSYYLNSKLVFHSSLSWKNMGGYFGTYLSGMILGTLLLRWLCVWFPACNHTLLSYAIIPVTTVWNFIFVHLFLRNRQIKKVPIPEESPDEPY